ncbi:MAG: tetratricopeptide repeat protein [Anaerolineaceae bacterium]|jgi:putative thioredoxin|nr:tetratricopeptide repeat protein [Anaerolineaceae bacterium]
MPSEFIIDVNETDFEYEVLAFSQNTPVVVDFWATWCRPCKTLSPFLEALAYEAMGSFRLAKVDVDSNPNLALQFGVRTVPTVKAFSGAQVVGEFVGNQPEERVRSFVANITPPSKDSLALEKGLSLLANHEWAKAEENFLELIELYPDRPEILLGLAKAQLGLGEPFEPLLILRKFPASKQYAAAEKLLPYAEALGYLKQKHLPQENDLDFAFTNSIRLASRNNIPAALDGLLEILKQDKKYRSGFVQKVILALFELLGEDDVLTRSYRAELASILF